MATRSASELWAALEEVTIENEIDAEMDAVLAMTPEERRRELVEAGFDLEKVHAQADALWIKMGIEAAARTRDG